MINQTFDLKPIGVVHSPFKEKFGIPRQAELIRSCTAEIELFPPYSDGLAFKGLEEFSDIWLIFGFHQSPTKGWRPLIRPPRLGGNKKVGVFASRSPFRPNNLGLSRVTLNEIFQKNGKTRLCISCPDIVDGTPIFDIKPYVHYADANEHARCGFAPEAPKNKLAVIFSPSALDDLEKLGLSAYENLKDTIIEVLQYDPRPAYKQNEENTQYGFSLYDLNIIWHLADQNACVTAIEPSTKS